MPIYTYDCEAGHTFDKRAGYAEAEVACTNVCECDDCEGRFTCGKPATRRPFYSDYGVSGLPTRGPIIPPSPPPRSTKGEKSDIWKEIMDMTAHEQHEHSKKYGRGGEYARSYGERPKSSRER